ncbi:acyl-CoA dehydrogenase family protein [Nonomuraea angiospora]|uniref:acyl-CoA dehydrogenase family protein n=1 Tax=Nonomuraea angiospora TaxID=46172 RepID=UPI00344F1F13
MTGLSHTVAAQGCGASAWLAPLRTGVPEVSDLDFQRLHRLDAILRDLLTAYPITAGVEPELRSKRLLLVREELARAGHLTTAVATRDGGCGRPSVVQTLMQFICGYHDIDLRDSTGLGHGRLIARHASAPVRDRWLPHLLAGALPGIVITERSGGSRPRAAATAATACRDGTWAISGTKTWISRLNEAAVFCVFFADPDGQLSAGVIDARSPGLTRHRIQPGGLSGWAWGELHLDGVRLRGSELLGQPGSGMALLRDHFAHYRPLVAATALGGAAAACDTVATHLNARRSAGVIREVRDNALITVGRAYAQISAALLAALNAQRLSAAGDARAELWGCAVKAHGVDVAYTTTSELTLLVGASGFMAESALAKTRRDLNGLLYADGIHDTLYRTAGRTLTTAAQPDQSSLTQPPSADATADVRLAAQLA